MPTDTRHPSFGTRPVDTAAALLARYPELAWLLLPTDASPSAPCLGNSLAQALFPTQPSEALIELNRTLLGLLVLQWLLEDNYPALVACQPEDERLSRPAFDQLRAYLMQGLHTEADLETLVVYLVLNDLAKVRPMAAKWQQQLGHAEPDHDLLLWHVLQRWPDSLPSFAALPSPARERLLAAAGAQFNLGQWLQGENVPASFEKLPRQNPEALHLYLSHALCDIAGAAGQYTQQGSLVLVQPYYERFWLAVHLLRQPGASLAELYWSLFDTQAAQLGLPAQGTEARAVVRLCMLLRLHSRSQAQELARQWAGLSDALRQPLVRELNSTGLGRDTAILLYYAPALLVGLTAHSQEPNYEPALSVLAALYQAARACKPLNKLGVYTVYCGPLANLAAQDASLAYRATWHLMPTTHDAARLVLQT